MRRSPFVLFPAACGLLQLLFPAVSPAQLIFVTNNNTITIRGYSGGGALVIPAMTNGYSVVNIANNAFANNFDILSAVIPDTVTNIGDSAFYYCTGLNSVEIGSNVVTIGSGAFCEAAALTSVTIPNSVVSIGDHAFGIDFNLGYVTIGSGVTNIGTLTFQGAFVNRFVFLGNAPTVATNGLYTFSGWNPTIYYLPAKSGWGPTLDGHPTTPWFPRIATGNADFGVLTNGFGFDVDWAVGQTVFVDASTDLTSSNWVPVETNTLAPSDANGDGTFYFSDPTWSNFPSRFYRVRAQ